MTRFLASVSNPQEAVTLLAAGADIIDIKDPRKGALGAVEQETAIEIIQRISGQAMTSATIGDLPMEIIRIADAMEKMRSTGVDIIKIGVFADTVPADVLQGIRKFANTGCRIVLVFFADLNPQFDDFSEIAEAGVFGAMLDTSDKTRGSLRTILDENTLESFVKQAQSAGLMTGLAGSLKLVDIQPLLKLNPDYLGFRSALCDKHQRESTIDMQAAHNIRAMIPLHEITESGKQELMLSVN
jgi:dihydroneopterin aldolase